jgi:O-antigen ligase
LNLLSIIIFGVVLVWVIYRFKASLAFGMQTVFALLVFLPTSIAVEVPGGFLQLTIHRALILTAFFFVTRNRLPSDQRTPIPNLTLIVLLGVSQFVSLLFSAHFGSGLKAFLSYTIEAALFYVIVSQYLQRETNPVPLLSGICYGLAAVALFAFIEKYFRINIASALLPTPMASAGEASDITSTYQHRILLGYAMAMGMPLAMAISSSTQSKTLRWKMSAIAILLIGAAYFSTSRGPWLGLALAVIGLGVVGGKDMRKKLILAATLAGAVLILRPGVRETIQNLYSATFDADSLKGGSYQTRWQLWSIAWQEIQASPVRFAFGYGPASTESMDLTHYFEGEGATSSISKIGYTSWDNNFACDLIELGVAGFVLEAILFGSISWLLFKNWRACTTKNRVLQGGTMVAALVFMFAMTNVFIFSPQLKYLFWALVATGSVAFRPVSHGSTLAREPIPEDEPWENAEPTGRSVP